MILAYPKQNFVSFLCKVWTNSPTVFKGQKVLHGLQEGGIWHLCFRGRVEEERLKGTSIPSLTKDYLRLMLNILLVRIWSHGHTELQGKLGNVVSLLGSPMATKHEGL